ncbi:hypothetical protein Pelo_9994 [Pelomyxa schiedti]|nr:hypothetical protein Pelo_9994 [Pelomyxa schiedti]
MELVEVTMRTQGLYSTRGVADDDFTALMSAYSYSVAQDVMFYAWEYNWPSGISSLNGRNIHRTFLNSVLGYVLLSVGQFCVVAILSNSSHPQPLRFNRPYYFWLANKDTFPTGKTCPLPDCIRNIMSRQSTPLYYPLPISHGTEEIKTLALGLHPRIGASSPVQHLTQNDLRRIYFYLPSSLVAVLVHTHKGTSIQILNIAQCRIVHVVHVPQLGKISLARFLNEQTLIVHAGSMNSVGALNTSSGAYVELIKAHTILLLACNQDTVLCCKSGAQLTWCRLKNPKVSKSIEVPSSSSSTIQQLLLCRNSQCLVLSKIGVVCIDLSEEGEANPLWHIRSSRPLSAFSLLEPKHLLLIEKGSLHLWDFVTTTPPSLSSTSPLLLWDSSSKLHPHSSHEEEDDSIRGCRGRLLLSCTKTPGCFFLHHLGNTESLQWKLALHRLPGIDWTKYHIAYACLPEPNRLVLLLNTGDPEPAQQRGKGDVGVSKVGCEAALGVWSVGVHCVPPCLVLLNVIPLGGAVAMFD